MPARARAHARAEAVRACSLALLGLVGPLHQEGPRRPGVESIGTGAPLPRPVRSPLGGNLHNPCTASSARIHQAAERLRALLPRFAGSPPDPPGEALSEPDPGCTLAHAESPSRPSWKGSPPIKLRRRRPSEDRPLPLTGQPETSPQHALEGTWDR